MGRLRAVRRYGRCRFLGNPLLNNMALYDSTGTGHTFRIRQRGGFEAPQVHFMLIDRHLSGDFPDLNQNRCVVPYPFPISLDSISP